MEIDRRFMQALAAEASGHPGNSKGLPVRLVRAAATVLSVDGIGLAIHWAPDLQTPLGASDQTAALVERLQFTVGEGPGRLAAEQGCPVIATETLLARQWPIFHDLLVNHTPIRSMLVMPLSGQLHGLGFASIYFTAPTGVTTVRVLEVGLVLALISEHLSASADWPAGTPATIPPMMHTPDARRRGRVWTAVGMIVSALQIPDSDALALLRGSAYAANRTLDDLAADLINQRLPLEQLRNDTPNER
jgi:hypothetical protein